MRYNENADAFLEELYKQFNAVTFEQKYSVLCRSLDSLETDHCFSHNPTMEQKCAMLEYEVLHQMGKISLVLA